MSNADKRTPHTDALETLGMFHYKEEHRDAIHLAVEPVVASQDLEVGQKIGIIYDTKGAGWAIPSGDEYAAGYQDDNGMPVVKKAPFHGIVDPFLPRGPKAGERFWFIMNPRMVTSLRHVWDHPDFPKGE